ncbi:MAG: hypothetical protein AW07_03922 [Candidatus Accumulibacter sp. SK-11]|nr:MAG: hypothetical protein AW07_03922 [Candidatus Accumulibacter sp. SK-11]
MRIASRAAMPLRWASSAKSIIMMAFFLTMPISMRMPIMAMMDTSMSNSQSMTSAPAAAEGRPARMVSGWTKLS